MFDRIKTEIETTQNRIRNASKRFSDERQRLVRDTRHAVHVARGEGKERLWTLETQALDLMDQALDRAEDIPVVSRVAQPFDRLVEQRKDALTAAPIPEYGTLNARNAARAVRDLGWVDLLKVERIEVANKNRKTVLQAIVKRQVKLHAPPVEIVEA